MPRGFAAGWMVKWWISVSLRRGRREGGSRLVNAGSESQAQRDAHVQADTQPDGLPFSARLHVVAKVTKVAVESVGRFPERHVADV